MQFQLVPPKTWFTYEDKLYLKTADSASCHAVYFEEDRLGLAAYFLRECEVTPVPFLFAFLQRGAITSSFRTEDGTVIEYNPSRMIHFGDLPVGKYFSHSPPTFSNRDIFLKLSNENRGSLGISHIVSDIQVLNGRGSIHVYSTGPDDMVYVCSPPY